MSSSSESAGWYEIEIRGKKPEAVEKREGVASDEAETRAVGTHGGAGVAARASRSFWHSVEVLRVLFARPEAWQTTFTAALDGMLEP